MSFLSLIAVFLIEQWQSLNYRRLVAEPLAAWADFIESRCNAGDRQHGVAAWCLALLPPVLLLAAVYAFLYRLSPLLAWILNVGALYLTMGFRQFSHHYSEIQVALRLDDLPRARELLGEWLDQPTADLSAEEIARRAIEEGLAAAHRHVFAVLLCFVILPGPCGAALYRIAAILRQRWGGSEAGGAADDDFSRFARRLFAVIDWLPSRATAAAFAIVGNFEDAVHCWRTQAADCPDRDLGIVLASGAGALGVRLQWSPLTGVEVAGGAELGAGDPPDVDFMQSAVALVWRATVLWMLVLFLLELARLAG
ncbi:MAG: CobD/CbiB family protein [Betaproteobacteria bacterium]|nr:CobD/CbiB family protein [Betaproteobacteria bacterium]MCL2887206.1 CobD/CbiB family protein [Betaproteobacteria bacterium]